MMNALTNALYFYCNLLINTYFFWIYCKIFDCLKAIKRAIDLNWFNLDEFNISEYERIENKDVGNISVIIPNKILAFRGPLS